MRISLGDVATGALAILLASLIQPYLPETITEIEPLTILNNPLTHIALISVVAFYALSTIASWIHRKLRINRRTASLKRFSLRRKPRRVDSTWVVERFGVKWEVLYGRLTIGDDRHAYAKEPRCPRCETELMTETESRRVRDDKRMWKCPGCEFTQERPEKFLHEEKEAVERMVERDARKK